MCSGGKRHTPHGVAGGAEAPELSYGLWIPRGDYPVYVCSGGKRHTPHGVAGGAEAPELSYGLYPHSQPLGACGARPSIDAFASTLLRRHRRLQDITAMAHVSFE